MSDTISKRESFKIKVRLILIYQSVFYLICQLFTQINPLFFSVEFVLLCYRLHPQLQNLPRHTKYILYKTFWVFCTVFTSTWKSMHTFYFSFVQGAHHQKFSTTRNYWNCICQPWKLTTLWSTRLCELTLFSFQPSTLSVLCPSTVLAPHKSF